MSTLNGFGTRHLGFGPVDPDGCVYATVWVTAAYLPLFPLERRHLRCSESDSTAAYEYSVLGTGKLVLTEVVRTYVFGWIVIPAIISVPFAFHFWVYPLPLWVMVPWFLLHLFLIMRWDDKRMLAKP